MHSYWNTPLLWTLITLQEISNNRYLCEMLITMFLVLMIWSMIMQTAVLLHYYSLEIYVMYKVGCSTDNPEDKTVPLLDP